MDVEMSTRSMQARQVLSRFGELAWFSLTLESHPVHGYVQVTYMGWRYASPREGIAQLLEGVVQSLPTQVEWALDTSRKNWLLLPARVLHEAQGLENPDFADAVDSINVEDQDFCLKALSDFELIIHSLQQVPVQESRNR
jgi:hypothetical protein